MSMGAPVGAGVYTLGGYGSVRGRTELPDLVTEDGDPGVYVPNTSLGAHVRLGLGDSVEIGGHFDYSAAEWAEPSGVGVLPLADGRPLTGLGAHVTVGHRYEKVGWGATLDATWLTLPYARYTYTGPPEYLGGVVVGGDGSEYYELTSFGAVHPIRIRATGAVTIPISVVDLSPGFSVCPSFTNEGFTDNPSAVFHPGPLSVMPVVDLGVWVAPARIGFQGWYAPGASVASGGRDTGWGARFGVDWAPGKGPVRGGSGKDTPVAGAPPPVTP